MQRYYNLRIFASLLLHPHHHLHTSRSSQGLGSIIIYKYNNTRFTSTTTTTSTTEGTTSDYNPTSILEILLRNKQRRELMKRQLPVPVDEVGASEAKKPKAAKGKPTTTTTTTVGGGTDIDEDKVKTSSSSSSSVSKKKVSSAATSPVAKPKSGGGGEAVPRDFPLTNKNAPLGNSLKLMSWNVAGLRASGRVDALRELVKKHSPDILCIQEHKLQTKNLPEFKSCVPGYNSFWVESTTSAGYSGVAMFVKDSIPNFAMENEEIASISSSSSGGSSSSKGGGGLASFGFMKQSDKKSTKAEESSASTSASSRSDVYVKSVKYEFDGGPESLHKEFLGEGRAITLDMNSFYVVGAYVPNSGQNLERLKLRVDNWDTFIRKYLDSLTAIKPVIYLGDLNVGHLDIDIHNPTAKHIVKQAGLTPEERNSMTAFLSSGYTDAFRFLYPNAFGNFTYWSMRTGARPVNKGIRLDYFIVSNNMLGKVKSEGESATDSKIFSEIPTPGVFDSYICHEDTKGQSDHCPVALLVKV